MHAIMHIGQPEYDAGHAAGERAKQDGIKTFICVNHFVNSEASLPAMSALPNALCGNRQRRSESLTCNKNCIEFIMQILV